MEVNDFILKSIHMHGDKYKYDDVIYVNNNTLVSIKCPIHGIFNQKPRNHLAGKGCPSCGSTFIPWVDAHKKFISVHGTLYKYDASTYNGMSKKLCIECSVHGAFSQLANQHAMGSGCPRCSGRIVTSDDFIKKSIDIHKNKYDYSLVNYKNAITPIVVGCSVHGNFTITPNKHLSGRGCKLCGINRRVNIKTNRCKGDIADKICTISNGMYTINEDDYISAKNKMDVICYKHGIFKSTPSNILSGKKCPKCSLASKIRKKLKTTSEFIQRAIAVHGNQYDYANACYSGMNNNIEIICNTHGAFHQRAAGHLMGKGCKYCSSSKGEKYVASCLNDIFIVYNQQKSFTNCKVNKKLLFDFYIPSINACIEYQGIQHYKSWPLDFRKHSRSSLSKRKQYDNIKKQYCKQNNIPLLCIPYTWKPNTIRKRIIKFIGSYTSK